MVPLFPILWLSHLMIVRYAVSGNAQTSPQTLHARFSSSNSTAKISKSIAGSQTYDSFSIRSNNVTAASTKSSDIGSCQQRDLDDKNCALVVGAVDLYFWPDPSRDTSCLSIVGNATNPPMQDASTRTVYGAFYNNSMYTTVYWGCTAQDSASGESFITTAVLATTGSMSVKIHLFNPWSSQPCSAEVLGSVPSVSHTLEARGPHLSAHVRRHPLSASSGITQNSGLLEATVTSGKFTFTSPSIYVNFHEVSIMLALGGAVCASFPVSMLTFSPEELSTIEGLHWYSSLPPFTAGTTKVFNFTDLPCPPQSVMEANWYTPEPGQPYRPLIALPRQLQAWNPVFSSCKDYMFEGYDPPRALVPAPAMAPLVTQAEPQPSPIRPRPNATPDPGPKETNHAPIPTPASAHNLKAPQSQQTAGFGPKSVDEGSGSDPVASSGELGGIGQERSPSSLGYQTGTDEDPEQKADSNGSPISNANEKSGQKSYPKQPPQGNSDTDPGKRATLNKNPSRSGHDNPGQVGQQADSSQTVYQQQSKGGPENNQVSWEAPNGTPDQRKENVAIGSQKPGQAATINTHIVQALEDAISIAGTTLFAGGPAITVSGKPIALGSTNLVVGPVSVQIALPPLSLNIGQATTLNGEVIQQLPTGISVAGTTLTPGAPPIIASGFPISLGTSALIIGSSSVSIALPRLSWILGPITDIGGEVVQPLPNGISVADTMLTPGGPAITVSGTPMSLGPNVFVIGTSSIPLATDDPTQLVTTIAGQTITANPTAVKVGNSTLTHGSPGLTLSGTIISLNFAGQLVVGSKTIPLDRASGSLGGEEFTTTVAGQGLTANPTAVLAAGLTLRPGGPGMTLSGTMISLDSSGKLILGLTTIALQSSTRGLGGLIVEGFISGKPSASESVGSVNIATPGIDTGKGVQAFRGDAESTKSRFAVTLFFWLLCACLIRLHLL